VTLVQLPKIISHQVAWSSGWGVKRRNHRSVERHGHSPVERDSHRSVVRQDRRFHSLSELYFQLCTFGLRVVSLTKISSRSAFSFVALNVEWLTPDRASFRVFKTHLPYYIFFLKKSSYSLIFSLTIYGVIFYFGSCSPFSLLSFYKFTSSFPNSYEEISSLLVFG
jgi:hypothetical protein